MKLTKEEQAIILAKREKEEANKPKKVGYLKHDLYRKDYYHNGKISRSDENNIWIYTFENMNEQIQNFKESFELVLSAGSKFDCYIECREDGGEESWYDAINGTIEGFSAEWARKNLRDIQDVKSKKTNKRKV